jgi:hypothetical protein
MSEERITWEKDIKHFFTQMDIGCMRSRPSGLDLSDYQSVRDKADSILIQVKRRRDAQPGQDVGMPKGGRPWPDKKIEDFEKWKNAGFPKE